LDRARALYKQFPDAWTQLRLHWIQGRIAYGLEQFGEAVHILRQVAEEFRVRDLHMEFLLVSIDLAEAHVAAGEIATAGRLLAVTVDVLTYENRRTQCVRVFLCLRPCAAHGCFSAAEGRQPRPKAVQSQPQRCRPYRKAA
jgi:hypothetical protein